VADLSVTVDGQDVGLGRLFGDLTNGLDALVRRLNDLDSTTATARADLDTSRIDQGLQDTESESRRSGERSGENLSSGMAAKLAGLAALGATVGGFLVSGLTQAMERETASAVLAVRLGATGEAAGNFGKIAGDLYANNFGGSMEEVNDAVVAVHQNIGESFADTDEIVSNSAATAMSLAQAFGVDVADAAKSVGQLLRTGLADDAGVAFDVITAGFQQGVDRSGDFLDTLNEYSPQFAKLGLDAHTSIGLLRQGLQGGARDADIVADAFKEFSLRAVDGSTTSAEGFKALGLNAEQMTKQFAAGGQGASEGLDLVIDRLRGMEDPVKRNAAGVALFGTQFEDMGVAFGSLDVSTAVDALGSVEGAAGAMNDTLGDTAAGRVETMRRALETGMIDFFGNQLIPMLETVAGWGAELFGPAWEPVKGFLGFLAGTGGIVVGVIMAVALATWAWTAAMGALSAASLPITGTTLLIAAGIALLIAGVIYAWNNFEGFRNVVLAVWEAVKVAFTVAWDVISAVFAAIVSAVTGTANFFSTAWATVSTATIETWNAIGQFLTDLWNGILSAATTVWTAVSGFFVGLWTGVVSTTTAAWNAVVAFLAAIWNGIVSLVTTVWGAILAYFQAFYAKHHEWIDAAWTWALNFLTTIWNAIYNTAMTVWNAIATFFTVILTAIQTAFSTVWNAIVVVAQTVWGIISAFFTTQLNNFLVGWQVIWNAVSSVFSTVWNAISAFAQMIWNAISSFFTSAWNSYIAGWTQVWNAVSSVFTAVWDGIRNAAVTVWTAISSYFTGALNTFTGWWGGVWQGITSTFERVWNSIRDIAQRVWDGVTGVFKNGVNAVIDAINWLTSKVNVVLRFFLIPEIPSVPKLASGGVLGGGGVQMLASGGQVGRVGGGFTTNGPMAIVGEGNPNHPEYVIPTDPKYRSRALALYDALGVSLMEDGGVLGWIGDAAGSAWGGITSAASAVGGAISNAASWIGGAATATFDQIKGAIRGMLPPGMFGDLGVGIATKLLDGIKKKIEEAMATMTAAGGPMGAGGGNGWQWQMNVLRQAFPGLALISGFRPGAITATGNRSYHSMGRAVDVPPRMDVFNWIRANYGANTRELIFSPAGGAQVHNGRPHVYTGVTQANHWDHVHWAMADGGIINRPTFGLVGEAGPEAVVPLTRPGRASQVLAQAGLSGLADTAGIEARLDALAEVLERRGAAASITVQDQSGDPAETARATVLALRLS
jgi:phage-related protein